MHFLTELPNELWLTVFSYLNTVDIFRAFHEFDERFYELVYEYARQVTLPVDITSDWLEEYMPDLENRIKIMCLDVKSLQDVFGNRWSFPNLRLINLQGNGWSMSLRIEEEPVSIILMSSLGFLQDAGIAFNTLYYHVRSNILDVSEKLYNIVCILFLIHDFRMKITIIKLYHVHMSNVYQLKCILCEVYL